MGTEIKRKLATVEEILKITQIEGADNIELTKVRGWQCIVGKNTFKEGDLGVFFEIDSFLPVEDRYEFLRARCFKAHIDMDGYGFRLRTSKFMGNISQGLMLPLKDFPECAEMKKGDDVTDLLNVVVYEPPLKAMLSGTVRGNFPSFIPKTNQERIQNLEYFFDMFNNRTARFEATEKLDGSSTTMFYKADEDRFSVCSRNLELKETKDNTFWKVAKKYGFDKILRILGGSSVALQGELIGPGVQKNPYKLKKHQFRIFDIYNIDKGQYLLPEQRDRFVDVLFKLMERHTPAIFKNMKDYFMEINGYFVASDLQVPRIEFSYPFDYCTNLELLLEEVKLPSRLNPNVWLEGVVFKSEFLTKYDTITSFKILNNNHLLKVKLKGGI